MNDEYNVGDDGDCIISILAAMKGCISEFDIFTWTITFKSTDYQIHYYHEEFIILKNHPQRTGSSCLKSNLLRKKRKFSTTSPSTPLGSTCWLVVMMMMNHIWFRRMGPGLIMLLHLCHSHHNRVCQQVIIVFVIIIIIIIIIMIVTFTIASFVRFGDMVPGQNDMGSGAIGFEQMAKMMVILLWWLSSLWIWSW